MLLKRLSDSRALRAKVHADAFPWGVCCDADGAIVDASQNWAAA